MSVKQYGLVHPGESKPTAGEVEIPFVKSSQMNHMFKQMMKQAEQEKK